MEKLINLADLLTHDILDLYSAEEQIIDALPKMIDKANDPLLKDALSNHLEVSKRHIERLDKVKKVILGDGAEKSNGKGFFSKLFGGASVTCKAVEALIKEAGKTMEESMNNGTMDAAIIGAAQKIEHYEISGYGTARTYAKQLGLDYIVTELERTLKEEYEADQLLTKLAVEDINLTAEMSGEKWTKMNIDHTINNDHTIPGVDHLATSPIK